MSDDEATDAKQVRRNHYMEAFDEVAHGDRYAGRKALDNLREKVGHLLDQLEAAETMPPKAPLIGVWQVELTNGMVHNFVADYSTVSGDFYTLPSVVVSPGMISFIRTYGPQGKGRPVAVLAVRIEKVASYRRLGDWDGDEDVAAYSGARWATAGDRPKSPTLPFPAFTTS
jgi:hypothetical protein